MYYRSIVFLTGDDFAEFEKDMEENGADWVGSAEWVALAFHYLAQWDYNEPTESEYDAPPWGSADDTFTPDGLPEYTISYHGGLSYVSLIKEISDEEN